MTTNERNQGCGVDLLASHRRRWGVPALAVTLLAGTSTGLAQNSGFGLMDAVKNQIAGQGSAPATAQPATDEYGQPVPAEKPVDFNKLEGSVNVNEYDLVDLHVNSEDLGAVLQLLSIQSQRNIISSNSVQASVTADLYGVTFYEALDAILHVNGFGYIEKGNFIYVYTREELEEFEKLSRKAISRVIHLDYLNATDAAEFAKHLLSDSGAITTSAESGDFLIQDGVPTGGESFANSATLVVHDFEENVEEVLNLVAELDTKPVQVLVEATILQTTLNEANAFGMDFSIISDMNFSDFLGTGGALSAVDGLITGIGQDIAGSDVPATGSDGDGAAFGSNVGNVGGPSTFKAGVVTDDVAVFMRVLDQITDVTVVSNPKLLTLNRQPARVLVGTRVGYLNTTTTDTATTQTVEFLDVGTQLAVRPFVSKNGLMRLELRPQVSNYALREVTDSSANTVTIPDEDTTEMTTNVMLRDGQTAVLGGLFTESTTSTRRQIPVLGDIPIIGSAFRGYDDSTRRTEIIFLITPSIVNDEVLTAQGLNGQEYLEASRVGARKSLLPFSRERRVGQLLIEARRVADEGDTQRAIFLVERALRLSPMSPDARMMKAELTGKTERMPSREIINGMLHRELLNGETRSLGSAAPTTESDADDGTNPTTPDATFAEAPTGPVSSANSPAGHDAQWLTAQVERAEPYAFGDAPYDNAEMEADPEAFAYTTADSTPAPTTKTPAPTRTASAPVTRYDAMKSVATAQPTTTPSGQMTVDLPPDWYNWHEQVQSPNALAAAPTPAADQGGFLIVPLPGGGALHIQWPISNWDWSNTYTEVPTDSFQPGVE